MPIPVPDGISLQMRDLFSSNSCSVFFSYLSCCCCQACLFLTFSGPSETFSTLSAVESHRQTGGWQLRLENCNPPTTETLRHIGYLLLSHLRLRAIVRNNLRKKLK